jgi:putative transposase
VSKLTNRDIEKIIKQRLNGKPDAEIARYFQVTRQRICQILWRYKETQEYPVLKQPGRRSQSIDLDSEELILESNYAINLNPIHLEKKLEETHGIHIPHNRIYKVLLCHGLVEINMKKRIQSKWVRYEREHSMSVARELERVLMYERKQWLITFMDDSSRLITCYGVFDTPTTENNLSVL